MIAKNREQMVQIITVREQMIKKESKNVDLWALITFPLSLGLGILGVSIWLVWYLIRSGNVQQMFDEQDKRDLEWLMNTPEGQKFRRDYPESPEPSEWPSYSRISPIKK